MARFCVNYGCNAARLRLYSRAIAFVNAVTVRQAGYGKDGAVTSFPQGALAWPARRQPDSSGGLFF
jgi:hypothetical protein